MHWATITEYVKEYKTTITDNYDKGGSNTLTGLRYEAKVELAIFLNSQNGYRIDDTRVYYNNELVARLFKKHGLYKFLKANGTNWQKHISKQLLPDNCIYVIINNTAFILEVKMPFRHTTL